MLTKADDDVMRNWGVCTWPSKVLAQLNKRIIKGFESR